MNYIFIIHSSLNGHLGYFQLPAVMNKTATDMMNKYCCSKMLCPGKKPKSGVAGVLWQIYFQLVEEPPQ